MDPSPFSDLFAKILAGVGVALLFSLAVFVHELGHFLAARWMGLAIDAFSIGFGPAIWKRRIGGIEYRVGSIPLGGYVALPQLDPSGMEHIQGEHSEKNPEGEAQGRRLPDIAPWRRIVVALAGPAGNLALACLLAWIVYLAPATGVGCDDLAVGSVATNSAAYAAGMRAGDRIVSVNNTRVANWNEFIIECHLSGDASNGLAVVVSRETRKLQLRLPVTRNSESKLVMIEGLTPRVPCLVGEVNPGSPAALAGMRPHDIVMAIDGCMVVSPEDMIARVSAHGERPVRISLMREGEPMELTMTPAFDAALGRAIIGINFGETYTPPWLQYRRPMRQLTNDAKGVVRILRALFAPRTRGEARRAAGGLSGPLVIMVLLWYQVRAGLIVALAFLRFLCVNLALLNLLPLPVLDGGHIVFALWEWITGRKPHPTLVNWLANIFAVLLIGLMILLVFRDALSLPRLLGKQKRAASVTNALSIVSDGVTNAAAASGDGGGRVDADPPLPDAGAPMAP